jgi:AraC-like DNA-binding protein
MLVVRSSKALAGATLTSTLVFARRLWLNIIQREGLALDTRFAPASRREPRTGTCVYLLLRGRFAVHGGASFDGPVALAFSEQFLEGARGVRDATFCIDGSPFVAIEIHLAQADAVMATASPVLLTVSTRTWDCVARIAELARASTDEPLLAVALVDLLGSLAEHAVVSREVVREVRAPVPFERLLRAVRPIAERFALAATLDELSQSGNSSPRQLDRGMRDFLRAFPLVGTTWRATSVHMRLKIAVLFLSAKGATVNDVAHAVGYGSTEAMARAFRDAGIPSPSFIRDALHA